MAKRKVKEFKYRPLYQQLIVQIIVLLLSMFLFYEIFTSLFFFSARVVNRAMEPNYQPGARIFLSRIPIGMTVPFSTVAFRPFRSPDYGSEVLINSPYEENGHIPLVSDILAFFLLNNHFSKHENKLTETGTVLRRVIGLPGDRVYISGGRAYIQPGARGDFLSEELLGGSEYTLLLPEDDFDTPNLLNPYYSNTITVPDGSLFVLPDNRLEAFGSESWGSIEFKEVRGTVLFQY